MKLPRFLVRAIVSVIALLGVSFGLLAATSAIALAIDWEIPKGRELKGPAIIYDSDGAVLARLSAEVEYRPRKLDDISKHLRDAVIATEDRRFYEHQGVDPLSVARAVWSNVRSGGIREGGSTLTQQYVKNVYVGSDQTLYRKIREALISLQIEKEKDKDEILEAYLNQVYFGEGAYGAEAAARTYFGVTAAELNRRQSATLASVLSAPTALSPRNGRKAARARRDVVLGEMLSAGLLTQAQHDHAVSAGTKIIDPPERSDVAPYFVEEVRRQLLDEFGDEVVYNGGLRVRTTLDRERQAALEREVRSRLPADPGLDAGVAVVDPATGDVMATWSGRDFDASQVDLAFGRGTDGRPSGSTFKVFALATALEEGMSLATSYPAPGQVTIGGWSPSGNGGCASPCTLREATARSSNTVYAQVAEDVGAHDFTTMARRLGVQQRFKEPYLPEVLGTSDVTPLDMASAMATLANDGVACPARVITDVTDRDGKEWEAPDPRQPSKKAHKAWARRLDDQGYDFADQDHGRCYRAVSPAVARNVTAAMEGVVEFGTGRRADIGRPQAGKTGTSQNNQEAWFVGFTPDIAMAVAFFNRDSQKPLSGVPGCSSVCFGGELPALIWHDAAATLLEGVKKHGFKAAKRDGPSYPDRRQLRKPAADEQPAQPQPEADVEGEAGPGDDRNKPSSGPDPAEQREKATEAPPPEEEDEEGILDPVLPDDPRP